MQKIVLDMAMRRWSGGEGEEVEEEEEEAGVRAFDGGGEGSFLIYIFNAKYHSERER